MNKRTRDQLQKHFGSGTLFNDKTKIPLCDVVQASYIMGDMNSEKFWNSIIQDKKERENKKSNQKKEQLTTHYQNGCTQKF